MGAAALLASGCESPVVPVGLPEEAAAPPATGAGDAGVAPAPEARATPAAGERDWRFSFTPFLWATRLDTTTKIDGRSTSGGMTFTPRGPGNSDNSRLFHAGIEWRPSTGVSVELGYMVLSQKYRDGDDSDDSYFRQKMEGPLVAISFRF